MKFIKIENFEIQTTPVTQAQWLKVMKKNPSHFIGNNLPVESVSWYDCTAFCEKLNKKQNKYVYRLPTEKEWELAARSCDQQNLDEIAWYYDNSNMKTHTVKNKKPNAIGLYDMLGNVWEWCQDLYTHESYDRVLRGGGWGSNAQYLRSANRGNWGPDDRYSFVGFRLVRTTKK